MKYILEISDLKYDNDGILYHSKYSVGANTLSEFEEIIYLETTNWCSIDMKNHCQQNLYQALRQAIYNNDGQFYGFEMPDTRYRVRMQKEIYNGRGN